MENQLLTEKEVLEKIGISSFDQMRGGNMKQLVSLFPQMDKETEMSIINQLPSYLELNKEAFMQITEGTKIISEANKASNSEAIAVCQSVIDAFGEVMKKDETTVEERKLLADKMFLLANKAVEKDSENKKFLADLSNKHDNLIALKLGVVALVFGRKPLRNVSKVFIETARKIR